MRWEDLTIANFENAVSGAAGVCVVPIGVIEPHGPHLPLSTDALVAHRLACAAAEIEPVLVFPFYPWGENTTTRLWPGSIRLKPRLVLDLLENVCAEISRNGCKKIIIFNGHGGNTALLTLFVQTQLGAEIDYVPYLVDNGSLDIDDFHAKTFDTERHGHACECEMSTMLYLSPGTTHPEWVPEEPGDPNPRIDHLAGRILTPVWWYGRYPDHYSGDARPATAEKGRLFFEYRAKKLAEIVRTIKEDQAAPQIYREYQERIYRH